MPLPILSAALPIIGTIIDKVIPDKNAAQAAKDKLSEMDQSGELKVMEGQISINLQEAKSESLFVAGWRPFVGWVCGSSLAWEYLLKPFAIFLGVVLKLLTKAQIELIPTLEMSVMMPVLLGMLGLGGMRSFEKWKNVNKER